MHVCPHCGEINNAGPLKARPNSKKPVRKGVWKCYGCCEQFTATVGTVFEDSHIPLHRWLLIAYLMCASKKGMSAHQIHRMTGISYKTVWFMCHRLRFAMSQHGMIEKLRGVVEVDEVWIGPKEKWSGLRGTGHPESKKRPIVSLMERSNGHSRVRSFHIERVTLDNIKPIAGLRTVGRLRVSGRCSLLFPLLEILVVDVDHVFAKRFAVVLEPTVMLLLVFPKSLVWL